MSSIPLSIAVSRTIPFPVTVLNTNFPFNATCLPVIWFFRVWRVSLCYTFSFQSVVFLAHVASKAWVSRATYCFTCAGRSTVFCTSDTNSALALRSSVLSSGSLCYGKRDRSAYRYTKRYRAHYGVSELYHI